MKTLIVVALALVLAALAGAGWFMLRRPDRPVDPKVPDKRMARALALRVAVSVGLFLFIMLGWKLGWIAPHGLPVTR
ncbi:MAG: DUF2909 domain-containing protein [Aquabacterium sp.]